MAAKTSIIMPAYNVAAYIGEAIESVRVQTRDDWALIVVDDGSTDNTAQVVRSFSTDSRIRLIQQPNAGAPTARNTAVKAADTEFLSLLDADDAYEPHYLEVMLEKLETEKDLAFCCCDAFTFIDARSAGNRCSHNTPMIPPVTLERVAAREFQVYTAASLRRTWYDRVGGYDPELRNAQDFDLWIRILNAGGRAAFINQPLAWYRNTPDSLSSNDIRLSGYAIRVYEKLLGDRPDMEQLCGRMIKKHQYVIALNKAKQALREGDFEMFHREADAALCIEKNLKLAAVNHMARLSPRLAKAIFRQRS